MAGTLKSRKAMTFMEIMIATVILAIALLPLFNMIHKGTEETDINAANVYAINKASEILNNLLDSVPFDVLRAGCPAIMMSEDIKSFKEFADPPVSADGEYAKKISTILFGDRTGYELTIGGKKGYQCHGRSTDPRGVTYETILSVEDIPDMTAASTKPASTTGEFPEINEFTFTFMKNPDKLNKVSWIPYYQPIIGDSKIYNGVETPRFELECKTPNVGVQGMGIPPVTDDIYAETDYGTTKIRLVQKLAVEAVRYTTPNPFCSMKRLIIQVTWNMDKRYFSDPLNTGGSPQRIHLMTLKSDIAK